MKVLRAKRTFHVGIDHDVIVMEGETVLHLREIAGHFPWEMSEGELHFYLIRNAVVLSRMSPDALPVEQQ